MSPALSMHIMLHLLISAANGDWNTHRCNAPPNMDTSRNWRPHMCFRSL